MGMIADVILTVTVVAVAAGTVTEFQFRVSRIRTAADSTLMGIRCLGNCIGCFIGTRVGERYRFVLLGSLSFTEKPSGIHPPGQRKYVQSILTKEEKIVGQSDDGEDVVSGKGEAEHTQQDQNQIHQGENPSFDWDDEKQQELGIGIEGSVAEEETQIQIVHISLTAENHRVNIHENYAGEVKKIKPECTPEVFHGAAQRIVTQQTYQCEENITAGVGQGIGDQTPDLSLKNPSLVKGEDIVENGVLGNDGHQVYQTAAQRNVQHQIGNAFVSVFVTK